eukprot:s1332_g5.t1
MSRGSFPALSKRAVIIHEKSKLQACEASIRSSPRISILEALSPPSDMVAMPQFASLYVGDLHSEVTEASQLAPAKTLCSLVLTLPRGHALRDVQLGCPSGFPPPMP